MSDTPSTTRLTGFATTFAATTRLGSGSSGSVGSPSGSPSGSPDGDQPGVVRRLLVVGAVTGLVAVGVLGAGFLISRSTTSATAQPSASAAPSAGPSSAVSAAAPAAVAATTGGGGRVEAPAPVYVAPNGTAPAAVPATTAATRAATTTTTTTTATKAAAAATTTAATTTYWIQSHSSGRCVDVKDSGDDGSPLQVWDCATSNNQKWTVTGGTLRSLGLCMDIANASTSNGAQIQVATCNGGWAQKWIVNKSHDLVNTATGKCADLKDEATANGTRLQLWTCEGTNNQKFSKK
ncbi:RICIN domain-containing protein [Actinoplanes sp. NPDC051851]|uniref:RICIN domain-containing protein n=1 Tax=Actinoplanes sp. NPDC051851 TaxID=3154753 RepID=UPI00343FDEB9